MILKLLEHLPNLLLLELIRDLELRLEAGMVLGLEEKLLLTLLVSDFLGMDNGSAGFQNLGFHGRLHHRIKGAPFTSTRV